jgi:dsDNA-specific endonuclease/ATPase MutS2
MFNKLKEQAERKLKAAGERYHSVKSEAAKNESSLKRVKHELETLKAAHQSVLNELAMKNKHCAELSERASALIRFAAHFSCLSCLVGQLPLLQDCFREGGAGRRCRSSSVGCATRATTGEY